MARFFKMTRRADGPIRRLLRRSSVVEKGGGFEAELMQVVGPEDGACACSDWRDAVVSVTGADTAFPTLDAALRDGLFHQDCRHSLQKFVRHLDDPEQDVQALLATELAVVAMNKRAQKTNAGLREKFESLYREAREADTTGKFAMALDGCRSALDLIANTTVFEDKQERVERALRARIRTIEMNLGNEHPGAARDLG